MHRVKPWPHSDITYCCQQPLYLHSDSTLGHTFTPKVFLQDDINVFIASSVQLIIATLPAEIGMYVV